MELKSVGCLERQEDGSDKRIWLVESPPPRPAIRHNDYLEEIILSNRYHAHGAQATRLEIKEITP